MIYLFHGTDTQKARAKAHALIEALQKKKPDASYFRQTADTLNEAVIEELSQSQGLFERKFIIYMDGIFDDAEKKDLLISKLEPLKESENIFVILEKKIDAKSKRSFEKYSEKMVECAEPKEDASGKYGSGSKDFNIFDMTFAIGSGNSKKAWMLFNEAREKDLAPEAIHGVLWWQMKKMYSKDPEDDKIKKGLFEMMSMYHDAHRGKKDFMIALEKFVLEVGTTS